jgi:transcriptional regulator with XRE-family HTH domain
LQAGSYGNGCTPMALDLHAVRETLKGVFERQDMQDACNRRDLATIIATLSAHGISQGKLAGLTGIPQGRLSEYKNGKRTPTLNTLEAFADGLGMPEHARRALGLAPAGTANAALADAAADPAAIPDLLTLAWMAGSLTSHLDRRAVLQLAATLVTSPLLGVEEPTERLAYALAGPAGVQDDTITFLDQRTSGLHRIEPMFAARLVHRSIMTHLREVTALLEGDPGDVARSRLARIAGESAVLAAWTAWDLGEGAHSARMYRVTRLGGCRGSRVG